MPTKSSRSCTASISAMSLIPSEKAVCNTLALFRIPRVASSENRPIAANAATTPAVVGSTIDGKTLLVPVDSGINSSCGALRAIILLVPSPPSETMTSTPSPTKARTARSVSVASWCSSISSVTTFAFRGIQSRAMDAIRNGSSTIYISFTPTESAPAAMRATMSRLAS